MNRFLCLSLLLVATGILRAQDKLDIKFGHVSAEDFQVKYAADSSTNAIIIAEIGYTDFVADKYRKVFYLEFKRQMRAKIVNSQGFDIATVEIPLYSSDGDLTEQLLDLKAYTYTLNNGKVTRTSLQTKDVFTEKRSKHLVVKKFTFPAIQENCLIEYNYTLKSDFYFNFQPWTFQGKYPRLWSEYNAAIPEFFTYVPITQGYQPYHITNTYSKRMNYVFKEGVQIEIGAAGAGRIPSYEFTLEGKQTTYRWVMKNVPPLKKEAYTTSLDNHIAKIEFQLSQVQFPDRPAKQYTNDWFKLTEELLNEEDFGLQLKRANNWLDDEMPAIIGNAKSNLQKTRNIYSYINKNFTATRQHFRISPNKTLKDIFKERSGSVGDINLLLIALLRHEDIAADPVILSTRDNGVVQPLYPMLFKYNYVVAHVKIDSADYYLDASEPKLGFNILPLRCYNGTGTVITKQPGTVEFSSDQIVDTKVSTVFIINDSSKPVMHGSLSSTLGVYSSHEFRKSAGTETNKQLLTSYKQETQGMDIKDVSIEGLNNYEESVQINCNFNMAVNDDIIYFDPLLTKALKSNPFSSAERFYPVEMPYRMNETYILNMDIPTGYRIDDMPKSVRVLLNDNEGMFEYLIAKTGESSIQLRSKIVLAKANFQPQDYQTLRDFFAAIVKKHSEQIVFKKIN